MNRIAVLALFAVLVAMTVSCLETEETTESLHVEPTWGPDVVLAEGVDVLVTASETERRSILALAKPLDGTDALAAVTIDYPLSGSIFPPEFIAPTFLWHDEAELVDRWLIDVALNDGTVHLYMLAEGDPPRRGDDDPRCFGVNNEPYEPTAYQASAKSWTPTEQTWETIKTHSVAGVASITIVGFDSHNPDQPLSRGQMTLTTSSGPVDGMIFYRDVPLMPGKNNEGVIKPLVANALPLIEWRLKDISRSDSRVVLTDMPSCANCHSFAADGRTLGMDIDGPTGDKGAYAVADIKPHMSITSDEVITWNAFPDKPEGDKTIGFLSQVSPNGQYVVTTVNESVYVVNFPDFRFLQVFYPTRGILAYYSRKTGEMMALPGADDPDYVHCDPVWSPDGQWLVFARATARDPDVEGLAAFANDPIELQIQYDLYRIPFDGGEGGEPERIEGASENGMSNTFPKVSPDGKWIVFVKCRNGQLMRPDSELWIVPFEGGRARRMTCNMPLENSWHPASPMASWHSFSPNGRWMVFSSKANTPYTQMFLTHIDEDGNDSPAILIPDATASNRAVNIPEFVKIDYDDLASISVPTVAYYRHWDRGNELMTAGRFAEAIDEFRKALEAEPTSTRTNDSVAVCLTYLGRDDEAIRHYRRSLQTNPKDRLAMLNLGHIFIRQGKDDQAVELFQKVLALRPTTVEAHVGIAMVLAAQGKADEAIEWCQKALVIKSDAAAHHTLGNILYESGRISQAMASWRRAIEDDPNHVGARTALGGALARQGQHDQAIEQYRKALVVSPRNVYLLNALGIALARRGRLDEAISLFKRAVAVDPDYEVSRRNLETARRDRGRGR